MAPTTSKDHARDSQTPIHQAFIDRSGLFANEAKEPVKQLRDLTLEAIKTSPKDFTYTTWTNISTDDYILAFGLELARVLTFEHRLLTAPANTDTLAFYHAYVLDLQAAVAAADGRFEKKKVSDRLKAYKGICDAAVETGGLEKARIVAGNPIVRGMLLGMWFPRT
ncbi:hypothetical protein HBI25_123020 [Parastagonospora nodorum]|nr:hypothetical protein HBH53_066900 [Parastagonospora nodorum]KAH4299056.1 hypothetical protein HBI02_157010 [Parastagonospora nodorum]KAH4300789.1 hypothetical protein HBI01_105530 [Parastagonospora nodorum]KAH4326036.1 hypothetical protein HBI00_149210 [Parastagonospora nodorum]KAH4365587.1 hypothetical protein HBH94_152770 [Parastagonospora nodorum]